MRKKIKLKQHIAIQCDYCASVNNLLDFSRIEAGRAKAQFQLTDISTFTRDLAGSFRSAIENAGLDFNVNCEHITQPMYVDRNLWEKIVLNLLSNAFKYTPNGSVTVSLSARNSNVELSVLDTGVGIPEEELPNLFQRFHRVQNATGRTFEGTGIGLSLVSEFVKCMAGPFP
jgi:signal transduction histidine kinase